MRNFYLTLSSVLISISSIFSQPISIAAAADLRFAMNELTNEFTKANPDIKIDVIYGSSGNLYQQIVNRAPFDIFFSADVAYPKKLDSLKLTESKPKLYAIGHLVLWSSTLDVTKGINFLCDNSIKRIAIANPAVAPYGKRAVECLNYYKLYDKILTKIVRGENVSQTAQFVLTGNADIGIIALSLALSPEMMSNGKYFIIDEKSYSKLEQSYVIIKKNEANNAILKFIQFVESEQARKIFDKFGFNLPANK